MQLVSLAILLLVACVSAEEVDGVYNYHQKIGIPLAIKIKAAEEVILANQNPLARIVGGNVAKPNAHPYFGGLLINLLNNSNIGVCGSSLVTPNRLVTAAHCWDDGNLKARNLVVVLGSNFLFSGGYRVTTSRVILYPRWTPATAQNNLAIIYIPKQVLLSPSIQPIALATNLNQTFAGQWAVAVGFGVTSDSQTHVSVLSVLNEVTVQVITVQQCRTTFGNNILDNTICTNGTGGVGTCWGDGGGPLVLASNGTQVLIGISTFSAVSGCQRGLPSGYSRMTSFFNFIHSHL